jgi:hypothetical protein
MSDSIPPPSTPPGESSSSPKSPDSPQGNLGSHAFSAKASGQSSSGIPQEIAKDVFNSLTANNFRHANELMQQIKQFQKDPALYSRNLSELLRTTKLVLEERLLKLSSPRYKYILSAIEKIEFGMMKKDAKSNPIYELKGTKILRKVIDSDGPSDETIAELASTNLPESMSYVLESAWLTLLGEYRHIAFAGVSFSPQSFQAFLNSMKKYPLLTCLSFSSCRTIKEEKAIKMGDKEAVALTLACEKCPSLRRLHFIYHYLGNDGVQELSRLTKVLEYLNLTKNNIGDSNVEPLMEALSSPDCITKEVILEMNIISDEGAEYLSQALEKNKRLKQFSLWGNHIGSNGILALAKALNKGNSTLEHLVLGDNLFDSIGEEKLLAMREPRITL